MTLLAALVVAVAFAGCASDGAKAPVLTALSDTRAAPFSLIRLFVTDVDPDETHVVRFSTPEGALAEVRPVEVTADHVDVAVPPYPDGSATWSGEGTVSVRLVVARAEERASATKPLRILALPESPYPAGAVSAVHLESLAALAADSSKDPAAPSQAKEFAALLATLADAFMAVPEGTATEVDLGSFDGGSVALDADDLAALDRVLLAVLAGATATDLPAAAADGSGSLSRSFGQPFDGGRSCQEQVSDRYFDRLDKLATSDAPRDTLTPAQRLFIDDGGCSGQKVADWFERTAAALEAALQEATKKASEVAKEAYDAAIRAGTVALLGIQQLTENVAAELKALRDPAWGKTLNETDPGRQARLDRQVEEAGRRFAPYRDDPAIDRIFIVGERTLGGFDPDPTEEPEPTKTTSGPTPTRTPRPTETGSDPTPSPTLGPPDPTPSPDDTGVPEQQSDMLPFYGDGPSISGSQDCQYSLRYTGSITIYYPRGPDHPGRAEGDVNYGWIITSSGGSPGACDGNWDQADIQGPLTGSSGEFEGTLEDVAGKIEVDLHVLHSEDSFDPSGSMIHVKGIQSPNGPYSGSFPLGGEGY